MSAYSFLFESAAVSNTIFLRATLVSPFSTVYEEHVSRHAHTRHFKMIPSYTAAYKSPSVKRHMRTVFTQTAGHIVCTYVFMFSNIYLEHGERVHMKRLV
jgi:hypothetical protein